jgi:hypothetical protein
MANTPTEKTLQGYARLAGFLYLFVMAAFVIPFVITGSLAVPGDFAQTARNVMASEFLYRSALAIFMLGVVAIILLSGAFYALFRVVDPSLAAIALALRIVEAVFMGVGVMFRFAALDNYAGAAEALGNREILHQLIFSAVNATYSIGFAAVSLGSTLFFYLFFKSRYIPRALAGFGMLASLLLGVSTFAVVLVPEQMAGLEMAAMAPLGIAEVITGLWLLIAGVNLKHAASRFGTTP